MIKRRNERLDTVPWYRVNIINRTDVAMMMDFTIGRLAKMAQVNVETIRYYERRALIPDILVITGRSVARRWPQPTRYFLRRS